MIHSELFKSAFSGNFSLKSNQLLRSPFTQRLPVITVIHENTDVCRVHGFLDALCFQQNWSPHSRMSFILYITVTSLNHLMTSWSRSDTASRQSCSNNIHQATLDIQPPPRITCYVLYSIRSTRFCRTSVCRECLCV